MVMAEMDTPRTRSDRSRSSAGPAAAAGRGAAALLGAQGSLAQAIGLRRGFRAHLDTTAGAVVFRRDRLQTPHAVRNAPVRPVIQPPARPARAGTAPLGKYAPLVQPLRERTTTS